MQKSARLNWFSDNDVYTAYYKYTRGFKTHNKWPGSVGQWVRYALDYFITNFDMVLNERERERNQMGINLNGGKECE